MGDWGAIAKVLEVSALDILAFNEKSLFTKNQYTHVGVFLTVNNGEKTLNEVQEARIKELQDEVKHLREEVSFLKGLMKK